MFNTFIALLHLNIIKSALQTSKILSNNKLHDLNKLSKN